MDLSRFPCVPLAHLPTPLEELPRLAGSLGLARLLVKRDDCTGHALGGNKTRKLEFALGDALARGADVIVTSGGFQSNHVRQTAAALLGGALALALGACGGAAREEGLREDFDLLIRGARIVDGTGAPAFVGDVFVRGDTIVRVRRGAGNADASDDDVALDARAARTIEARGRVLAPGFIDLHAHGDPLVQSFESFLAMGVTTVVLGQDGSGVDHAGVAAWLDEAAQTGVQTNVALLAGHGTLRRRAGIGDDVGRPSAEQLAALCALLDADLAAGAFGLSTGLEYVPGIRAEAAELGALAAIVGHRDGVVMSHMRTEDEGAIEGALDELFAQGAHARVHVSHLKIVFGRTAERGEALLAYLAAARARGLRLSADAYPYAASYAGVGLVFPSWARPPADYAEVVRARRGELVEALTARVTRRNGPEAMLFGVAPYAGRTLAEVAATQQRPWVDVLVELGPDGPGAAHFVMHEPLQDVLVASPMTAIASDGGPTLRHPRSYGTFAKLIERYVRVLGVLTLEEAVRQATTSPASVLGLADRGVVREGAKADLLLFDPQRVHETAEFADPFRFAAGFDLVLVNGRVTREDGALTTGRYGALLRAR